MVCGLLNKRGHAQDLKTNGAVVFRGFEISKDKATFGQAGREPGAQSAEAFLLQSCNGALLRLLSHPRLQVGQALELDPCEDRRRESA